MPDHFLTKFLDKISVSLFIVVFSAVNKYCESNAVSHDDPTEQSEETEKSWTSDYDKWQELAAAKKRQQKHTKYIRIYLCVVNAIAEPAFFALCLDKALIGDAIFIFTIVCFVVMRVMCVWHQHVWMNLSDFFCVSTCEMHTKYGEIHRMHQILTDLAQTPDSDVLKEMLERHETNTATEREIEICSLFTDLRAAVNQVQNTAKQTQSAEQRRKKSNNEHQQKGSVVAMQLQHRLMDCVFCMSACILSMAIAPQFWHDLTDNVFFFVQLQLQPVF